MEIQLNNKTQSIPDDYTVSMLLFQTNYPKASAVFINGRQILFRDGIYFWLHSRKMGKKKRAIIRSRCNHNFA